MNLTEIMTAVAILGIAAQWIAWRYRMPAIVLLAAFGILAGPVFGVIDPEHDLGHTLETIIKLCVAIILFEGGFNLRLHELKDASKGVLRMVTLGPILSWGLGTAAAYHIGGLSLPVSLIFGAIIVVTGPTVIMPLLRQANLKKRPASILKWEGIVNDPTGALLTVLVYEYFVHASSGSGVAEIIMWMGAAIGVSIVLGVALGMLMAHAFEKGWVPEVLKAITVIGAVLFVYNTANFFMEEAGLLATTILGMVLGNMKLTNIDELRRFKEHVTILLVSVVFILITATLDFGVMAKVDANGIALTLAIIFLVRPIAIMLSTIGAGLTIQERLLISWIAPRGVVAAAVAGVISAPMMSQGYEDAVMLVPLIFTLIFSTVVIHGFSLEWIAKRLGLSSGENRGVLIVGASNWSVDLGKTLQGAGIPIMFVDKSWDRLKKARLEGLPVHYGEILSETMEESLELGNMRTLLTATENDAYNALVATQFGSEFGRDKTYQLPSENLKEDCSKGVSRTSRGRIAFDERAIFDTFSEKYYFGWRFQKTRITDEYTFEDYQKDTNEDGIMAAVIRDGKAEINSPKFPVKPKSGDTVISFLPPKMSKREKKHMNKEAA